MSFFRRAERCTSLRKPGCVESLLSPIRKCYIFHKIIFFILRNGKMNVHKPLHRLGFLTIVLQMQCYTSVTFLTIILMKLEGKHQQFAVKHVYVEHTVLSNLFARE